MQRVQWINVQNPVKKSVKVPPGREAKADIEIFL